MTDRLIDPIKEKAVDLIHVLRITHPILHVLVFLQGIEDQGVNMRQEIDIRGVVAIEKTTKDKITKIGKDITVILTIKEYPINHTGRLMSKMYKMYKMNIEKT